ncbi:MAG: N-acetylmuramic acid 6-phosphate etherase [Elusimicrobia bacterium]|nr:N-acetylmuramic acid 6-phosphate etherase [Elusimicrobiota bacterium]
MRASAFYARLPTEKAHTKSGRLDALSPAAIVSLMNREDLRVVRAVRREKARIVRGSEIITRALESGGRLFFVGAGTSGRLGVLEAAEMPPTFGTSALLIQAIMAGGRGAVFKSREGAEDDAAAASKAVRSKVRRGDVVVGVAASGATPYVRAALSSAKRRGCSTLLVSSHPYSGIRDCDLTIAPKVGPEILSGATRLKSATAAKMVLNMLTLTALIRRGKVYGNLMVDLKPVSRKLVFRAVRLIRQLGGVPEKEARRLLQEAKNAKAAILMARRNISLARARKLLDAADGSLRRALEA